jgi:glycosyltransferase involved in cell wall biosynthesis
LTKSFAEPVFKVIDKRPAFSIITVVLNAAAHLEKAIKSVIAQERDDVEYIIVDGGSTDGTLDIIRRYAAEGHVTRYVSEPDNGIADAFNKGIALSSGELIGLLNADDVYLENALSKVMEFYRSNGSNGVIHGNNLLKVGECFYAIRPSARPSLWKYVNVPYNHPGMFVSRNVYEKVGVYNNKYRLAMDFDFYLRAMSAGIPFAYLNVDLVLFGDGGLSAQSPVDCYREVLTSQIENGLSPSVCKSLFFLRYWAYLVKELIGIRSLLPFRFHKNIR